MHSNKDPTQEGRKEGRMEGRKEGRKGGRKEGREGVQTNDFIYMKLKKAKLVYGDRHQNSGYPGWGDEWEGAQGSLLRCQKCALS